jgi:hypothetical protein
VEKWSDPEESSGILAVSRGDGKGWENAGSNRFLELGREGVEHDYGPRGSQAGGVSWFPPHEGVKGKMNKGGKIRGKGKDTALAEYHTELAYRRMTEKRSRSPSRGWDSEAEGRANWS